MTPLCRGDLKDSGRFCAPYLVGAADAQTRRPAFQRSLIPTRSLLPERFRGPVAPSAAGTRPLSPAPGGWDAGTLAETGPRFKEGFAGKEAVAVEAGNSFVAWRDVGYD